MHFYLLLKNKRIGFFLGLTKHRAGLELWISLIWRFSLIPGHFSLVLTSTKQTQISNIVIIWTGLGLRFWDFYVNDIILVFCLLRQRKKNYLRLPNEWSKKDPAPQQKKLHLTEATFSSLPTLQRPSSQMNGNRVFAYWPNH